jgi:nucleotide-binding universal stress UspA family protein
MNRHYRIVASLDDSAGSEAVLEHTLAQAARHEMPEIHLLAVASTEDDVLRLEEWLANVVVSRIETSAWRRPGWQTYTHVRDGVPEEEIASFAGEVEADLIVIGRRGVPARSSPSDRVLSAAICPTLVIGLDSTAPPPCAVCTSVREESRGACWYCAAHERDSRTLVSRRIDPPRAS